MRTVVEGNESLYRDYNRIGHVQRIHGTHKAIPYVD